MIERHNFILTGNNDDICFSYCVFAYSIYVGVNESNEIMWRIKCCLSYSFILIMILSICIANDGIIRISARTMEIQKLHLSCLSSLKAMILHSKWYIYVYLFRYSDSLTRTHMKINKKNTLTSGYTQYILHFIRFGCPYYDILGMLDQIYVYTSTAATICVFSFVL